MGFETVTQIIMALGGLGLFLYGMKMLGNGLELAAGAKLRKILEKITSNRWLGALVGIVVTAIIQSSTAVSVMVVGFVNASLMTLAQAMGVLMGATIGTTVTSLILSFNISQYTPLFICIGAFMLSLTKKNNTKYAGQIIAGFGILFFGMTTMSANLKPLAETEFFKNMITSISNPFLGILFGIVFAALIQSSSAAVGILQALGTAGALALPDSVYIIYGIHIGACFTAILWDPEFPPDIPCTYNFNHSVYAYTPALYKPGNKAFVCDNTGSGRRGKRSMPSEVCRRAYS